MKKRLISLIVTLTMMMSFVPVVASVATSVPISISSLMTTPGPTWAPTPTPGPTWAPTPTPGPTIMPTATPSVGITASGTCGDNLTWTLDNAGTLTISGTGAMRDWDFEDSPWYSSRKSIKKVIIGDSVTAIGEYAFSYCNKLTSVTIPDSVTTIGNYAFRDCDSLTSVTIPDSVTTIGNYAFCGCDSLTSVTIPDSVTAIGDCAFFDCNKLTSVTIPDSVTAIGDYAFSGCDSLTSVTIPDSVTAIGDCAFSGCDSLTSVTIPDSVTNIGDWAFYNCDSLTSVTIPDSVTAIGDCAFSGCYSLTSIVVDNNNSFYSSDNNGVLYNKNKTTLIQYPAGNTRETFSIPDSVTTIGKYAFYYCDSLTSVTIPDSVTAIGNYAFRDCRSLTSVTIGDSVTTIGDYAFSDCDSLTSVTIGDSVTTIGDYAFYYCSSLTSVTISDSVTTIGDCAFSGCYSLTSVTIGDSVTTIGDDAFRNCYSLTDVYYAGSESDWAKISISSGNDPLKNATIHYGSSDPVSKTYIMTFRPGNNETNLSSTLDLTMNFNTSVSIGSGKVYIKNYKTDKTEKTLDISGCIHQMGSNTVSFANVTLDPGKTYYVTMDGGAVIGSDGSPFYGIHDKNVWKFATDKNKGLQKTTYVGLEYPKDGNLWWKTDNTELPPIPVGSEQDYMWELYSWAEEYGVENVSGKAFDSKIMNMPVKIPVTDVNGQTFLLNDKSTTVKQVMQDLIFIEHLQPYIQTMDEKFDELTVGGDGTEILNYGTEREIYNLAESYAVEVNRYLNSRVGKEKSSFFLSVSAPLMYTALIDTVTNGQGEMESEFIRTYADATIKENALQGHIKSISGTSDYNTYKQGLSDVKNYVKMGKEIYKISTNGVSTSTAKLGADMFNMYLKDSGIGGKNETLNMISEAWSEFMTSKSCAQMSMFLGNSLGYFPYVVDLHTKLSKKVSDTAKAWYFVADYCIAPEYPGLIDRIMDESYILDNGYSYEWDIANNGTPDNNIAKNWLYQAGHTRSILLDTSNIISTRRDMTNAANFFNFAKTVNVEEVKKCLLNYISAELNKGRTTEVYGKCPIVINVYDKENNLVATLSSNDENDNNTEYGSFYLLGDDNNTKYFILASDEYRMEIVPYEDGEMDIAITQKDETGEIVETSYYDNVSIAKNEVYSADLSLEKPVLIKNNIALNEDIAQVESISISSLVDEVACGETIVLSSGVYPEYAEDKTITWTVDDNAIATIDDKGNLTGVSAGKVTVTATASNGVYETKEIGVYEPVMAIKSDISELAMLVGEEYDCDVSIAPEAASQRTVKWTSSDSGIATVNEDGVITAKTPGETIITATADGVKKEFFVTVSDNVLDIKMNQSDIDGDKIKIDIQNMSCISDFDRDVYIAIFESKRMVKCVLYNVKLAKQEKLSDYIDIELGGKDCEAKVFVWDANISPLQRAKSLPLIISVSDE